MTTESTNGTDATGAGPTGRPDGETPSGEAPPTDGAASRSRGRSVAAGLVGVVAVLGMVAGVIGLWTIRTATDSERFEEQVGELLLDEEVSDALARRVVTEVVDAVGLRESVEAAVPEVLLPAVDLLAAGVRGRIEDRLAELIRTPEVAEAVAAAAGRSHEFAIDVIEGDALPDSVDVTEGEVRVNLLPLTARALTAMQEVGLLRDVTVPDLERGGDPVEQRAELAAALDRDLPTDFGTPVVYRSDSLARAGDTVEVVRDVLVLAKRTAWFLLIGGLALAALAIWLSRLRWRSASFLVAGVFLFALIVRLVMSRATDRLPNAVEGPGAKATIREVAVGLEQSLNRTMAGYAALGLVVLAVAATVQFDLLGRARRRPG